MDKWEGKSIKLRGDICVVAIDNEGLLLDTTRRCYYALNETAAFLLKQLEEKCLTPGELCQEFVDAHDVELSRAWSDIKAFLDKLSQWELLTIGEEGKAATHEIKSKPSTTKRGYQAPSIELEAEILTVSAQVSGAQLQTLQKPSVNAYPLVVKQF